MISEVSVSFLQELLPGTTARDHCREPLAGMCQQATGTLMARLQARLVAVYSLRPATNAWAFACWLPMI